MALAKESVLHFIKLMEPEDRASLFSFSHDVTEVEPLTRDLERMEHRHNSEDHRCRVEKDGNTTCSYPDLW